MTVTITEALAAPTPTRGGRLLVRLISPGVGSSGVYPAPVIEAAARARVFPAGTHLYIDHPTASEDAERPERSVRDLAGVLTQDAYWDGSGLVAEAKTYAPWSDVLADMRDDIGMSIRATARVDEADDQGRPIIAELVEGLSVDFVTRAGRGGQILQVLESARVSEALPGGLTAGDLEARIDAWSLDHTDTWVVYRDTGDDALLQQDYTLDEQGRVTLTGQLRRVARRVTYDTLDSPSSPAGVATESHHPEEEPPMAQIQIDEAEHKRLTDTAALVAEAQQKAEDAEARAIAAEAAVAKAHADADQAAVDAAIAGHDFTALEADGLRSRATRGEDGRVDLDGFRKTVAEAAAEKATVAGFGRPTGLGAVHESTDYTEADLRRDLGITTKEA